MFNGTLTRWHRSRPVPLDPELNVGTNTKPILAPAVIPLDGILLSAGASHGAAKQTLRQQLSQAMDSDHTDPTRGTQLEVSKSSGWTISFSGVRIECAVQHKDRHLYAREFCGVDALVLQTHHVIPCFLMRSGIARLDLLITRNKFV